jgi:serine protease Do
LKRNAVFCGVNLARSLFQSRGFLRDVNASRCCEVEAERAHGVPEAKAGSANTKGRNTMTDKNKIRILSISAGLAVFVCLGLLLTIGASKSSQENPKPAAISESTVAPALQLEKAFAAVAAHVKPAVVSVYSEKTVKYEAPDFPFPFGDEFFHQFFGQQFPNPQGRPREYKVPQRGMGSGMIIDKQGHILTNYHVVDNVDKLNVRLADQRRFDAEIVGTDPRSDVAIIKIKGKVPDDLPTVDLGDSDALQAGDLVIAVGAPFGLIQTVTQGIISATGRQDVGISDYEDFLQTDAPINPGNSGGPLVNMRGQVIGMNSAIATSVGQFGGVGFAIPVNMIKTMLPTLIKGGKITRGLLGVVIQEVNADLAKQFHLSGAEGALVSQVKPDSPAAQAGIKVGDVIVAYDGKKVEDTRQLRNWVAATMPGTRVKIDVIRDGKRETLTATVGTLTAETAEAGAAPSGSEEQLAALGLKAKTLTPQLARQYGLENEKGVLITGVEGGSVASMAGLQAGDLIAEADRQPVTNVRELAGVLAKAKNKDRVLFLIKRQGGSLFVVLQTK